MKRALLALVLAGCGPVVTGDRIECYGNDAKGQIYTCDVRCVQTCTALENGEVEVVRVAPKCDADCRGHAP